jgi:hypothetical protein
VRRDLRVVPLAQPPQNSLPPTQSSRTVRDGAARVRGEACNVALAVDEGDASVDVARENEDAEPRLEEGGIDVCDDVRLRPALRKGSVRGADRPVRVDDVERGADGRVVEVRAHRRLAVEALDGAVGAKEALGGRAGGHGAARGRRRRDVVRVADARRVLDVHGPHFVVRGGDGCLALGGNRVGRRVGAGGLKRILRRARDERATALEGHADCNLRLPVPRAGARRIADARIADGHAAERERRSSGAARRARRVCEDDLLREHRHVDARVGLLRR